MSLFGVIVEDIDGLMQERCNSIANALEFLALTHRYVTAMF